MPTSVMEYRRLRAPREDRGTLIDPPLHDVPGALARNAAELSAADYDVQGRPLSALREQARGELIRAASEYTRRYRDVDDVPSGAGLILTGHQPELFHPGVWYKNFVAAALARENGAAAVHLLVDNDTVQQPALRVPGGTIEEPTLKSIPIDAPGEQIPYEERRIWDRDLVERCGREAADEMAALLPDPLIRSFWPRVVRRSREFDRLGACLAAARHELEGEWGLNTLEVPQSRVCELESFRWLLAHLLAGLPRLWSIYNEAVAEYRRVNGVRSANHPVPDLAEVDGWLEAPLWIWQTDDPRRRRLFVRQQGDELALSDREGLEFSLPLEPDGDATRAVEALGELPGRGIKLRTRALGTTLAARLLLGDLFIHGIGGAKYDQLTDALFARFFGLQPPTFLTVTATLHLPVEQPAVSREDVREAEDLLRELTWNPQRHLAAVGNGAPPEARELVEAKRHWIATEQNPGNARERFEAIRSLNDALQPWVEDQRREVLKRRARLIDRMRAKRILASREYAFCLYPERTLRDFLLAICEGSP